MSLKRNRHLAFEQLEARLALSATPLLAGAGGVVSSLPSGGTLTVLNEFAKAYGSHVGQANYIPAFDLNHNGQIGQSDAKLLLRALPAVAPRASLTIALTLAPQDRAKGPVPQNSGGVTHGKTPTVLGHTAPGALIFTGTGATDLKLAGPVLVADTHGDFSYKMTNTDGINQLDFQVVDRYGRQVLRAYPILWLNFAQYEAAHPKND